MNDDQFRTLLDSFGYSWEGYRKVRKGVVKRLVRYMAALQIHDAGVFMDLVGSDPEIRREARRLMTVSVSRFFRDRPLWTCLKDTLIPELAAQNPGGVAIWSAGCALGQEAYSFAMLWRFLEEESGPLPSLSIIATDMNREYLERAMAGLYESRAVRDIPSCLCGRFLRRDRGRYLVMEEIRRSISWQVHDLVDPPPKTDFFHLVFLRNSLLTYLGREHHERMLRMVSGALRDGGYLVIGARETLPVENLRFREIRNCPGAFRISRGG